ncbi:LCP family protein [Diaminobutyricimonas aerilata]|nr:LCP family protein [Diaminobutyricimonas aerilata]
MTRRAWWLVLLNLFIPGSAQVLAGNRRLGRFGLGATLTLWTLVVVAAALFFFWRTAILWLGTNVWVLSIVQVGLVFYAVLWVILTIDAIRLARLVRAAPSARPAVAGLAIVGLVAVAGVAGYGALITGSARDAISGIFGDGQLAEPVDGRYNILLLGGDAGPDRLGLRPDSITVVSVDAETGATTMIGIPRNLQDAPFAEGSPLWNEFPDGYDCGDDCLVSYLYTHGEEHPELYPDEVAAGKDPGVEAMMDAAEGVTGLVIQYYVLIDMQGFASMVDALGGVDIDVKERLALGANAFPDGTPADPIGYIEAGQQHMDGATALWYARSRYQTTDYDRMRRQREVQEAIAQQFEPANVITKFQGVAAAGQQVVHTDIPSGMLARFGDLALKTREHPITDVELVPPLVEVDDPHYDAIHQAVADATAPVEAKQ